MQVQLHNFLMLNLFFFIKKTPSALQTELFYLPRQFQNSSKLSKRPRFDLTKGAFSAVTLQAAGANYPLQLFANGIESHFLNDF